MKKFKKAIVAGALAMSMSFTAMVPTLSAAAKAEPVIEPLAITAVYADKEEESKKNLGDSLSNVSNELVRFSKMVVAINDATEENKQYVSDFFSAAGTLADRVTGLTKRVNIVVAEYTKIATTAPELVKSINSLFTGVNTITSIIQDVSAIITKTTELYKSGSNIYKAASELLTTYSTLRSAINTINTTLPKVQESFQTIVNELTEYVKGFKKDDSSQDTKAVYAVQALFEEELDSVCNAVVEVNAQNAIADLPVSLGVSNVNNPEDMRNATIAIAAAISSILAVALFVSVRKYNR